MHIGLHVKYPLFLSYIKLNFFFKIFSKKYSNIKFHENPSSGSRVFAYGQIDRQTDITKPVVAFRNFANVSNKEQLHAFYSTPVIIRRMRWAGHVPLMEQQRNA